MNDGGKAVVGHAGPVSAAPLDYAPPPQGRGHSAWSVVGFSLACVCLIGAAIPWWHIFTSGATSMSIGISPAGYVLACLPMGLCLLGLRRGRKLLAIAGMVISLIGLLSLIVVVAGSPWR